MKRVVLSLMILAVMVFNGFSQSILQEGFESNLVPPAGWTLSTTSSDPMWSVVPTTSTVHSGQQSLKIPFAEEGYYHNTFLVTPQLELTGHKILSFWYAMDYPTYAEYNTATVEISTSSNDISDFSVLQLVPATTAGYQFFNIIVDLEEYSGQSVYIAFHVEDEFGTSLYLDDVQVYDLPTCVPPASISVDNMGLNEVTLSWPNAGGNYSYELTYKSLSSDWSEAGSETVTDTSKTLTGLQPASRYQARVRTLCDAQNYSQWSDVLDFNTSCEEVTVTMEQPWFEDFDSIQGGHGTPVPLSVCWSALVSPNNYSTPYVLTGWAPTAHSGENSVMMTGDASAVNMMLLPTFSNSLNTLRLGFYANTTSATVAGAGLFEVGYVTDPSDPESFVALESVTPRDSSLGRANSVYYGPFDFFEVPNDASRIAIRFTSTVWNTSWNLDDISVSLIPECAAPTRLSVEAVNSNSVRLKWDGWENLTYDVLCWHYGSPDTLKAENVSITAEGLEMTGLQSSTTYRWTVRAHCEGGSVIYARTTGSFTTPEEALELPYLRTFEEDGAAEEITIVGSGLNQWRMGAAAGNPSDGSSPSHSMYISNNNGLDNVYGNNISQSFAILNVYFPDLPYEYHLSFDYKVTGEPGWDMFYVYMVNAGMDITPSYSSSGTPNSLPGTVLLNGETNKLEWTSKDFTLNNVAGTTKQIVFYWYNDGMYNYNPPAAVDNIAITYYSCPRPTSLVASTLSSDNAQLNWIENGEATSWKLFYRPSYSQEPYEELLVEDTPSFLLEGLFSNTEYDCYVMSFCGDGEEFSNASDHLTFRTLCGDEGISILPYVENFNSYVTIPDSPYPTYVPCWTRLSSNPSQQVYVNANDYSVDFPLDFNYTPNCYTMAVLPVFSEQIPLNSIVVSMDVRRSNLLVGTMEVGTLSDPEDGSTFQAIDTVDVSTANTWEHYVLYCDQYTGSDRYLAIRVNNAGWSNQMLIDNLRIDPLPGCMPVSNLQVSDITETSAMLTWDGQGDSYGVYVFGSESFYQVTENNSLELEGLQASSNYTVLVETYCGVDSSEVGVSLSFFTECGEITVTETSPWTENFDNYQGALEHAIPLSPCWATPLTMSASNGVFPAVYRYAAAAHSGSAVLEVKGGNVMVVLPEYSNDINELRLTLWGSTNSNHSAGMGMFEIGIVNGTSASSFVPVHNVQFTQFGLVSQPLGPFDFISVTPEEGQRIAIRYRAAGQESCYLDDFMVTLLPSCPSPESGSVQFSNVSANSAQVSWTDEIATHNSWTVYYKPTVNGESSWMTVTADGLPTATLSNLLPSTMYDVYVVTNCNGAPGEDATSIAQFITTQEATPIPYTANFSDPTEWNLLNGNCVNRWMTGPLSPNSNYYGLFVSDNGSTPAYEDDTASLIVAEKLFTIGDNEEIIVNFDVEVGGEATSGIFWDYMKLFFAKGTDQYTEVGEYGQNMNLPTWANADYSYQAVDLSGYVSINASHPYALALTGTNPIHISAVLPNPNQNPVSSSTAKLVFVWRNDYVSYTAQPGAVITNLTVAAEPCPHPSHLEVTQVNATTADVSWSAGGSAAVAWTLGYKAANEETWTTVSDLSSTNYTITGLQSSTFYTFRVASQCSGIASDYAYGSFETTQCDEEDKCDYIFHLTDSGNDGWNGAYLEVKQLNTTLATMNVPAGQSSKDVTLHMCTDEATSLIWHTGTYDFQCAFTIEGPDGSTIVNMSSLFGWTTGSVVSTFTTQCPELPSCAALAPSAVMMTGKTTTSATFTWVDNGTAQSWIVEYKQPAEETWHLVGTTETAGIQIQGLQPATDYVLHIMAICSATDSSVWSQNIPFTTAAVPPVVQTLPADYITYNSATLHGVITEHGSLEIELRGFEWKTGASGYTQVNAEGDSILTYIFPNNLNANTLYKYRAFVSTADTTVYGDELTFTTQPAPAPCNEPTDLMQTAVSDSTISIVWTDNAEANEWDLRYRTNNGEWSMVDVYGTPSYTLEGLNPTTQYVVQVRAVCDEETTSDWSFSSIFTTTDISSYLSSKIVLYPNPAKEVVNVECTMDNEELAVESVEVFDVYGKLLKTLPVTDNIITINVSGLASGMYFVRVNTEKGAVTKTFVKK